MGNTIHNDNLPLKKVQDFLIKIAGGDYSSKLVLKKCKDEQLLAIQEGINMLVEELKETTISRIHLNSIYNGINDILIVLNDKVEIQQTNQGVETLLLFTESELLNRSIGELIQKKDFDIVRDAIRNTYLKKKISEITFSFITKNKKIIPVSCSFSPLFDGQGKSSGTLLVAKNISNLINVQKQLQDKNDELNLFVYKASHDLKSPVSSMMGILALLKESADEEETKLYCKMISECAYRLDNIISDLLILGRISYGELEYMRIDLIQLIDGILSSIVFVDGFKDIKFNVTIDENAQSIVTEKGLLTTVFFNLIDNAIKYRMKEGEPSFINIHISSHENGILFKIEDNGIGIAESQKGSIFKMFYRATTTSKGSGLGLFIVHTSVLKLGGSVSLESTLDKGTTFKVYIPSR